MINGCIKDTRPDGYYQGFRDGERSVIDELFNTCNITNNNSGKFYSPLKKVLVVGNITGCYVYIYDEEVD